MTDELQNPDSRTRKAPRIKAHAVSRYVPPALRQTRTPSSVAYPRSLQCLSRSRSSLTVVVAAKVPCEKFTPWIAPIRPLASQVDISDSKGEVAASFIIDVDEEDTLADWAIPVVDWFAATEKIPGGEIRFDPKLNSHERAQLHQLVGKDSRLMAFSQGQGTERFLTIAPATPSFVKPTLVPTANEQILIAAIRIRLLDTGGESPGISEFLSLLRAPGGLEKSSPRLYEHWVEVQRREKIMDSLAAGCAKGDLMAVSDLIKTNRWALFAARQGRSPLSCAVSAGHVDIVKLLLAHGVPTSSFCYVERISMQELARRSLTNSDEMVALFS